MIGVFVALDLFLFYVFWEVMLVPMYFLIGIWGGERRIYAAVKFFLYTMVGSLLMLVAIIDLLSATHGTSRHVLTVRSPGPVCASSSNRRSSEALPVPGLLRSRSRSRCRCSRSTPGCPTRTSRRRPPGSVILAGVLLKMGTYGFLRFCLPLFPRGRASTSLPLDPRRSPSIGIIYGALVAMVQPDMKKLVAYSLGQPPGVRDAGHLRAQRRRGSRAAFIQMLNHGLSTGALFLLVGVHLRAPPHPRDRRLRRAGEGHAGLRRLSS